MQAIILAGGLGSRLSAVTAGLPKALVDIAGKPLVHRQIELIARHGFTEVLLLLRHGADHIRMSCGDGSAFGMTIHYMVEVEARGTAGAVLAALDILPESVAILYGDTVLNVDLARMRVAHVKSGADATLFVHPNNHPRDSDLVETDAGGRVVAIHPYPHPAGVDLPNLVNAGLYMMETRCLRSVVAPRGVFDFGRHLFPMLLKKGRYLSAYRSREYIKDAGTPDRLKKVIAEVRSGHVADGSFETKAQAVFLDRDGTLNEHRGYITAPDQLHLFPGVAEAIRRLNRSRYLSVVVTNQPIVARGAIDELQLQRIHNRLEQLLALESAYVDAIYYCPHHPDRGFAGERPDYKISCSCRKPATGLIERAIVDMNIDVNGSWMIGDTFMDVEMARRAGLLSVLLATGDAGRDAKFANRPDFMFLTLGEAMDFISGAWPDLAERASTIADGLEPGDLVLIGGLAQSGKSSFASALAWQLRNRGRSTSLISLDGWLKPVEARLRHGTVIDRFDLPAFERSISRLLHGQTATIMVPIYNRLLRRCDRQYTIDIGSSDIVIVEGVSALMLSLIGVRRLVRVFVLRDEGRRYEHLAAQYRARHFTSEEFKAVYAERQQDETPYVLDGLERADLIVETP